MTGAVIRIKPLSDRNTSSELDIEVSPSEKVEIINPRFKLSGERLAFDDGFLLSHGRLSTSESVEVAGISPAETDFQLYCHIGGKSSFESNGFAPINFNEANVALFRRGKKSSGISTIAMGETVNCFELNCSTERLMEWFDQDPPKSLKPMLSGEFSSGLHIPLPTSNIYFQMSDILRVNLFTDKIQKLALEGLALQMFASYFSFLSDEKLRDLPGLYSKEERVAHQAREILLSDLSSPPSLSELSRAVGIAPRRLNIAFKEVFGESVFQTLSNARLDVARTELTLGYSTIKEVAYAAGYNHVSNFSAAFKTRFGISPAKVKPKREIY